MPTAVLVAAVWTAHVGFDRLAGYGLKHPDEFAHTHLSVERRNHETDRQKVA